MTVPQSIQNYFNGWKAREIAAILDSPSDAGTYDDRQPDSQSG